MAFIKFRTLYIMRWHNLVKMDEGLKKKEEKKKLQMSCFFPHERSSLQLRFHKPHPNVTITEQI